MVLDNGNVKQLMDWLADGGEVRSASASAEALAEKLASLVFHGDQGWPDHAGRVDQYRNSLGEWFAGDGGLEPRFVELTGSDADPDALIDWFLPVVLEWEERAARGETDTGHFAGAAVGLRNPSSDGTPGTEYYRFDEATGEYQYAASADATEWASYEQRRYSEPTRDENYGLNYRHDRTNGVYEWYDEASGTWNDQSWADQYAAGTQGSATTAGPAEVEWDDDWAMFYRIGPGGVYEFAHAVTPGDRASGCGDGWLSQEQVAQQRAQGSHEAVGVEAPGAGEADHGAPQGSGDAGSAAQRQVIVDHIPNIAELVPGFDNLTDDQIAAVVKEFLAANEGA